MYGDLESYANWKVRGVEYTSDEFELKAEASLFTGMEWVWLNKELVSKKEIGRSTQDTRSKREMISF